MEVIQFVVKLVSAASSRHQPALALSDFHTAGQCFQAVPSLDREFDWVRSGLQLS